MTYQQRYERSKVDLLNNESICQENRELFREFLAWEEHKLKRTNRLSHLDEPTYKTLSYYVSRLQTVNRWFQNKPWKALSKEDIQRVFDGVEDGLIVRLSGKPFRGRDSYYNLILLGKPFELAGKKTLSKEVLEFRGREQPAEVRFLREDVFRQFLEVVIKPEHKALLWLAWDVGENAAALLRLTKKEFERRINEHTGELEYAVTLRREILKRSRLPRTVITNYKDTVRFLDLALRDLKPDEHVFEFGPRMASKVLDRATGITGARCIPAGQKITLKDLRSSMACDLLSKGWTTDEVNRRLGHRPSSREIDKYVNWLALDGHQPKRKFQEHQVSQLKREIEELRDRAKLSQHRQESLQEQVDRLKTAIEANNRLMYEQVVLLMERTGLQHSVQAPTT